MTTIPRQTLINSVIQAHLARPDWSNSQLALTFGTTADVVQKIVRRYSPDKADTTQHIPPELTLTGNRVIVADVHVPTTDMEMAKAVLEVGRRTGVDRLTLVGDLFCQDMFGRWATLVHGPGFQEEIEFAQDLFDLWFTWFKSIEFCRGNHDDRLIDWTQGHIAMRELAKMISPSGREGDIVTTMRNYFTLDSGGERWTLMHQRQYNRYPLKVACDYAEKLRTHVLCCHQHHCAIGVHEGFTVVDCGCLADPAKTMYKQLDIQKFPDWEPGFVTIINGRAEIYSQRGLFGGTDL